MKRTKVKIAEEIKALEALKPVGAFARRTAQTIALGIEELRFGFDDTAAEFHELGDSQRDFIMQCRRWKEGEEDDRPSTGWGELVSPPN